MDMDYGDEQIVSSPKKGKKGKFEEFEYEGPSLTHQQLIDQQNKILGN